MGRSQERAIWLMIQTLEYLKGQKLSNESNQYISRTDLLHIWNLNYAMSMTVFDQCIAILKAECVLGENNRQKTKFGGYFFNKDKFDLAKKIFGVTENGKEN